MKRRFRVNVEGKIFTVEVEEIREEKVSTKPVPEEKSNLAPSAVTSAEVMQETATREVMKARGTVVTAPLPGVIESIKRKVSDRVKAGDLLLTLEAMKMENEILAPASGVLKRIAVSEKQKVNEGDILAEIE